MVCQEPPCSSRLPHWVGVKLTVPQLNKIKNVNPRQLEHVYDEVVRMGDQGNARFALSLILK